MQKRYFFAAACVLLIGLAGAAQAKTDFTGDWKANIGKSDFGPIPPPDSLTMKIDHHDPDLKVNTKQTGMGGDVNFDAKYTTDGKESTNMFGPMEAKSTVTWDGDELAVTTKLDANGTDIVIKGKWTLSADGKTFTQTAHVTSPQGEFDMKYVLEKQEAGKEPKSK